MQPDKTSTEPESWGGIEEIFEALESPLLAYALRFAPERSAAEDLVMEAFMKLHEQYSEVRHPRRWLYRTVHNLALNQKRAGSRVVPMRPTDGDAEAFDPPDEQLLPDEQIARWERIGLVRLSFDKLDPRSRELVRLKFLDGLSYKEIGTRTGITPGHVGYLLHHALKGMADELARNGVSP